MSFTQLYCNTETRIRLKALAYIDKRGLAQYLDILASQEIQKVAPKTLKEAIEAVTDG